MDHDFVVEARTIGEVVRMAVRLIESNATFDTCQRRIPLSEFFPAPEQYWSAYMTGIPISLTQLGVVVPEDWEVCASVAYRHPVDAESDDR